MKLPFIGWHGVITIVAYALFILGSTLYLATRGVSRKNLSSFYLANKGLGPLLLFFTLFATQYSGNTVIGYPATAYRLGFAWWQSVPYMVLVIAGYLLFAPRLHVVSKKYGFVTPSDWFDKRFNSKAVTLVATLLMAYGLLNYLLEQLVAMGQAISGLTAGVIPYIYGVIFLVTIMLIYEWMGGMKAVALADFINGVVILIGVIGFVLLAWANFGSLSSATQNLIATAPKKVAVPPLQTSVNWISMYILVGIGAAVYPHAIQRIYAAESEKTLKKSLLRMAWMPFFTTGVVFLIGIIGTQAFPGLDKMQSEQLVGMMANVIAGKSAFNYWFMMLLFSGVIAAIMSTTDSVLLSLSSLLSNDIYGKVIKPNADEAEKVIWGKIAGIILVFCLLWIAWKPPATLVEIFTLKFEVLIQVAPAFLLGLYWRGLSKTGVLLGMLSGAILAGGMTFSGMKTLWGWHGGVLGLGLNIAIAVVFSLLFPDKKEEQEQAEEVYSWVVQD
ncbi:sodium:solute symporter [Gelria sp. Kuro-4]|uniref:sodium:solute symporter family protein n=1 Tax=Gelria sp. Kuro-4 TaxID=2796927 RepID=UPI001BEE09F9|nr:sodium:solute symporter family protein [Gelria sp. Kuro-4]BCV23681.1 sodium/panthothenate symporter [Gelria sp. Kuro-4]